MRHRLFPLRPLGWFALVLALLVAPTPARAAEACYSDPDSAVQGERARAETADQQARSGSGTPAIRPCRADATSASDESESSGKDDVSLSTLPAGLDVPPTTCTTIRPFVAHAVTTRRASIAGPRAPPSRT
jgi:hypothetical protein